MSEANSPTFARGIDDGLEDEARIKSCPSLAPYGPAPPFPEHPIMYLRGYYRTFSGAPHVCTERCRRRAEDREDSSSAA